MYNGKIDTYGTIREEKRRRESLEVDPTESVVGVIDSKSDAPYSKSIREMYNDWVKRIEEADTSYIIDIPTESEDDIGEINVSGITTNGVTVNEVMVKNATISKVEFEERRNKCD